MTMREAKQRAAQHGCYLYRTIGEEVKVGKHRWNREQRERMEYFTDDLEDAVLTAGRLKDA